jgi:hypothetical protein
MKPLSIQAAFDAGFALCKAYIDAEVGELRSRIAALENRSAGDIQRELGEALRKRLGEKP